MARRCNGRSVCLLTSNATTQTHDVLLDDLTPHAEHASSLPSSTNLYDAEAQSTVERLRFLFHSSSRWSYHFMISVLLLRAFSSPPKGPSGSDFIQIIAQINDARMLQSLRPARRLSLWPQLNHRSRSSEHADLAGWAEVMV